MEASALVTFIDLSAEKMSRCGRFKAEYLGTVHGDKHVAPRVRDPLECHSSLQGGGADVAFT